MFGKSNFNKGLKLRLSRDFVNAINKFNKAIESGDLDVSETYIAYVAKGSCLNYIGNSDEAIKSLECALQCINTDYQVYGELGKAYLGKGKYELSIEYLDKAIELNSDDINSWAMKGYALFNLDKYDDAETTLNFALSSLHYEDPEQISFLKQLIPVINLKKNYDIGTKLLIDKRIEEAQNIFDSILESIDSTHYPDFTEYLNQIHERSLINKGNCQTALKRYDSAIEIYKEALEISIDHKMIYHNIASCYLQQNMTDKALEYFAKEESYSENELDKRNIILGKYSLFYSKCLREKNYQDALKYACSVPETNNDYICWKKIHIGISNFYLENYDETLKNLLPYIDSYLPDALFGNQIGSGIVNTYLGGVYYKRNDYQTALKYLEKCDQIVFSKFSDTGLFTGECYIAIGEYEKAVEVLQKAVVAWDEARNYDIPYLESRIKFAKEKLGDKTHNEAECPACPVCGAKVGTEDAFCGKCGSKL